MNKLQFENTHYKEALNYTQQYSKTKNDGYYIVDLTEKGDQILTQQNNTIITLLTSLHHRLTLLENKLLQLETLIQKITQVTEWKKYLENLTKDLSKLSTGNIIPRRQQKHTP